MKVLKIIYNFIKKNILEIMLLVAGLFLGAKAYENFKQNFSGIGNADDPNSDGNNERRKGLSTGISDGLGRINDIAGELQGNQSKADELNQQAKELDRESEQLHSESEQLNKRSDSRIDANKQLLDRVRKANKQSD